MKKIDFFTKLSINVVIIFLVVIVFSLVPDNFPKLFGDEWCSGVTTNVITGEKEYFFHYSDRHMTPKYHWGYRHWMWSCMGARLFVIQILRIRSISKQEFERKFSETQ